jgi:hypothetical protein
MPRNAASHYIVMLPPARCCFADNRTANKVKACRPKSVYQEVTDDHSGVIWFAAPQNGGAMEERGTVKKITRNTARMTFIAAVAASGCCFPQEPAQEMHVDEITAQQTREVILASPLCQQTRERGDSVIHKVTMNSATPEPDLVSLMEKSDEVVLIAQSHRNTVAISSSGKDVATYLDAKVLRSWKGQHKPGDTITYAIPSAHLHCTASFPTPIIFLTCPGVDWEGNLWGPIILFLRQSRADETQFLPGLRLAGGNGLPGAYVVPFDPHDHSCEGFSPKETEACRTRLDTNQELIFGPYLSDPLLKTYDGMPASRFLQKVQSVARSLGYPAPAEAHFLHPK